MESNAGAGGAPPQKRRGRPKKVTIANPGPVVAAAIQAIDDKRWERTSSWTVVKARPLPGDTCDYFTLAYTLWPTKQDRMLKSNGARFRISAADTVGAPYRWRSQDEAEAAMAS